MPYAVDATTLMSLPLATLDAAAAIQMFSLPCLMLPRATLCCCYALRYDAADTPLTLRCAAY